MHELRPTSPEAVRAALAEHGYLADEGLATVIFLAITLRRPLLLEGEAGVGKTEVAKALARWASGELIRLQCYEGLDVSAALYEWDHARQMLALAEAHDCRRVRLLAYFIAEGSLTGSSPGFTNTDPAMVSDFKEIVVRHFPQCAIRWLSVRASCSPTSRCCSSRSAWA